MSLREPPPTVSESWERRTAWAIFFVVVAASLMAAQIAGFVHDTAVKDACTKHGGVLADDGHGHKNCVHPVEPIEEDKD